MKLLWFHLMPYTRLPDDFAEKHPSVWVDIDSRLFDPAFAHELYNEFMDELEHADRLGLSRREFLLSACGAATAFLALNACTAEGHAAGPSSPTASNRSPSRKVMRSATAVRAAFRRAMSRAASIRPASRWTRIAVSIRSRAASSTRSSTPSRSSRETTERPTSISRLSL